MTLLAYNFYEAATLLEQLTNPTIDERVQLNEMFRKAFDLIVGLRATPLKEFGRKVDMSLDPRTILISLPVFWGVNIHKRLDPDKKQMVWVTTISMTSTPTSVYSMKNTVAGRAPTYEQALFAAIMRAGHHIEINRMTSPFPTGPGPVAA
jgi:hypothetical protein